MCLVAVVLVLLLWSPAHAQTPPPVPPITEGTIYDQKGVRQGEVKTERGSDRFDIYDTRGNRLGYGQRNKINGDIDFYDTRGNRQNTLIRPGKGGSR